MNYLIVSFDSSVKFKEETPSFLLETKFFFSDCFIIEIMSELNDVYIQNQNSNIDKQGTNRNIRVLRIVFV